MGSGLSNLGTVSRTTLYDEVVREYNKIRAEHESAIHSGAVSSARLAEVNTCFEQLGEEFTQFKSVFTKTTDNSEVVQLALALNDKYREYRALKSHYVFEVGDIVQVRDDEMPSLFIEGVVFDVKDMTVRVKITDSEADQDALVSDATEWREIQVDSDDIRKIRSWDFLERGDRVRVKEGCLYFQGIVVGVSDDGEHVTVDFACEHDAHSIEGASDDSSDEEEESTKTVHRQFVEKIDTRRIAMIRFKDYVRRVQKSILVTKAFRATAMAQLQLPDGLTVDSARLGGTSRDKPASANGSPAPDEVKCSEDE